MSCEQRTTSWPLKLTSHYRRPPPTLTSNMWACIAPSAQSRYCTTVCHLRIFSQYWIELQEVLSRVCMYPTFTVRLAWPGDCMPPVSFAFLGLRVWTLVLFGGLTFYIPGARNFDAVASKAGRSLFASVLYCCRSFSRTRDRCCFPKTTSGENKTGSSDQRRTPKNPLAPKL